MATKLQAIIDFVYQAGGVDRAIGDMGKLANSIGQVGKSATQMSIESAVLDARTSMLSNKMKELSTAVAQNKMTVSAAESEYQKFEATLIKVPPHVDETKTALQRMNSGLTDAKNAWLAIATPIQSTIQILQQVGRTAKQAYEFISEGTQLARTQDQFDALSKSIGTTADALLGDLKTATRGTISDAQLMASATSIMSLGLADTSEETVRLASLVGKLGWDMNQVTLTIANQSTMRLDSLGLSVSDVESRIKALREQGYATDEAFKFAIMEAGEAKVKLLGDAADTTAGKLKILEANAANLQDNFQATFSETFITRLNDFSGGLFETAEGASAAGQSFGELVADTIAFGLHMRTAVDVVQDLAGEFENGTVATRQNKTAMSEQRAATIAATAATDGWMASLNTVTTMTPQATRAIIDNATALYQTSDAYAEFQDRVYQTSTAQDMNAQKVRAANLELEQQAAIVPVVTGYIAKSKEQLDAFTVSTGQYFMAAAEAGDSLGFFNENLQDLGTHMVSVTTSVNENAGDLTLLEDAYDKAAAKVKKYQLGIEGATLSEEERAEKIGELQSQMANYQAQMDGLGGAVTTYSERTVEATINQDAVNQSLIDSIAAAGGSAEEIGAAALALGTMSEAQVEAAIKAAELEIRIASVRQAYLDGRISADELTGAIQQQVDIVNGMTLSVGDATGSVGLLGDSMYSTSQETQTLLDKFGMFPDEVTTTVNVDTGAAEAKVTNLYNKLKELGDPAMPTGGGSSGGSSGGSTGGGNIPGFATGADFIVPPGYPNDSYPMRVQSGERVQVTPAGQSSGGNTYNLYVTAMDGGANVAREFNYMKAISNV